MYPYPYLDNIYLSQSFFLLPMNFEPTINGFFSKPPSIIEDPSILEDPPILEDPV